MSQSYLDASISHSVYLQRLTSSIINDNVPEAMGKIAAIIEKRLGRSSYYESGKTLSQLVGKTEYQSIINAIISDISKEFGLMWEDIVPAVSDIAPYEAGYTAKLIESQYPVEVVIPSESLVISRAANEVMVLSSGATATSGKFDDLIKGYNLSQQNAIKSVMQSGYKNGLTNQQIIKQLNGTKSKGYTDGLLNKGNGVAPKASTLVRTATNSYSNVGREEMAKKNNDIIEGKVFSATFDSRTTTQCRDYGNEDKVWKLDDPKAPSLPLHYNERSIWIYKVYGYPVYQGTKASKGAEGGKQIQADTTQDEWLKRQPDYYLKEALGAEWKAKVFKEGLSVSDFYNRQLQKSVTLDELKAMDNETIQKAIKAAGV